VDDRPTKTCRMCGETKPLSLFRRDSRISTGYAARCMACTQRQYRLTRSQETVRLGRARRRLAARNAVFDHYGWTCRCCGATEDLSIDHVRGGGTAHRRTLFRWDSGTDFYLWLVRQGFPAGYQTLCMPCNRSKADGPRCRLYHLSTARRAVEALSQGRTLEL
jgi:hypothetical protein